MLSYDFPRIAYRSSIGVPRELLGFCVGVDLDLAGFCFDFGFGFGF